MNPFQIPPPLQNPLAAPAACFARHRNYSYASLQEQTTGTSQVIFRYGGGI
jgi:hypothetical protein